MRPLALPFLLALLIVGPDVHAQTAAEDAKWSDTFGSPGVGPGGYVRTFAVAEDGDVYVGGYFATAGGVPVNHVARWDGRTWHALGSGTDAQPYVVNAVGDQIYTGAQPPRGDSPVKALAVSSSGSVYAAGHFTRAGGKATRRVARWDGTAWHPLGGGIGDDPSQCQDYVVVSVQDTPTYTTDSCDEVYALAVGPDGMLYAGGKFAQAGGVAAANVARWTGSSWQPLGAGTNGQVLALAFGDDGALYAGGSFTQAGWAAAVNVARWDGTTWNALPGGSLNGPVNALAVYGGQLYVGGSFTQAGNRRADRVARYDGTQWRAFVDGIRFGTDRTVYALAVDATGVYAASVEYRCSNNNYPCPLITEPPNTEVGLAHWNGTEWVDLDPISPYVTGGYERYLYGHTYAVTLRGNEVITAVDGGAGSSGLGRYDRSRQQWLPMGGERANGLTQGSQRGLVSSIAAGPDGTVYVGGTLDYAGGLPVNNVAAWDGIQWSDLGGGFPQAVDVFGLGVAPDGKVYASFATRTVNNFENRVMIWDGTSWQPSGKAGVTHFAFGPDGTTFVGLGSDANVIDEGSTQDKLIGTFVAQLRDGVYTELDGPDSPYDILIGTKSLVTDAAGLLYASSANNSASHGGVAVWNGMRWMTIAGGAAPNGLAVYALAVGPDGQLYAGGQFERIGGVNANSLARWDGSRWHRIGTGFRIDNGLSEQRGVVQALRFVNGQLYVSGVFNRVYQSDGTFIEANGIVRWNGTAFEALGQGFGTGASSGFSAMVSHRNALWVGGHGVITAGGKVSFGVARYYSGLAAETVAVQPRDGQTGVSTTPELDWADVPGAASYRLQVAIGGFAGTLPAGSDAASAGVLLIDQVIGGAAYQVPSGVLGGGTTYAWRVAPIVGGTEQPFTEPARFTTGTAVVAEPNSSRTFALRAPSPNPLRGEATIEFEMAGTGRARLVAYDMLGREVALLVDGELGAGPHAFQMETGSWAAGVYVLRLEAAGHTLTRRVTVAR